MKFTYKIDGFNKYENKLSVLYTPEDTTKDPILFSVFVTEDMTEQEIEQVIINQAPLHLWNRKNPPGIENLLGRVGEASIDQIVKPEPQKTILTYPDGTTSGANP